MRRFDVPSKQIVIRDSIQTTTSTRQLLYEPCPAADIVCTKESPCAAVIPTSRSYAPGVIFHPSAGFRARLRIPDQGHSNASLLLYLFCYCHPLKSIQAVSGVVPSAGRSKFHKRGNQEKLEGALSDMR